MFGGIYSGATAMDNYARQQDLTASNLAHLNTAGFRRQFYSFEEKTRGPDGQARVVPGAEIQNKVWDFSEGVKKMTDRTLDVAINGDGFFVYQGSEGNLYSRNGVLYRGQDGTLTNAEGMPILEEGEPIVIAPEISHYDIKIDETGQISANGEVLGKLSMVRFENPQLLQSEGQVYFRSGNAAPLPAEDSRVMQGFREMANSHPVTELISLIVGSRHFEAAQRAIRTISDSIQENTRS